MSENQTPENSDFGFFPDLVILDFFVIYSEAPKSGLPKSGKCQNPVFNSFKCLKSGCKSCPKMGP